MSTKVIPPKELLEVTIGGLSVLVVAGGVDGDVLTLQSDGTYAPETPSSSGIGGSTGSVDNALIRADGTGGSTAQAGSATLSDLGALVVTAGGATTLAATFKAAASQTANITEWQSSAGAVGACVTASMSFSNAVGGSLSESFGAGATAGVGGVAVGNNAVSAGNGVAVGRNTTMHASSACTAIGYIAVATGAISTGIGNNARAQGYNSVAVGDSAWATTNYCVALGAFAYAKGEAALAVGNSAAINGAYSYCTAVGSYSVISASNSTVLGYGSTCGQAHTFVCGSSTTDIKEVFFGKGISHATPTVYTINGTGGSGTNIAGANINIAGGKGTGTGAGGSVVIQVAPAGSTGSSANALADVGKFDTNATAGETRFMLWDVDSGTLKRVSVGAADSGGTGFKVLRIPN